MTAPHDRLLPTGAGATTWRHRRTFSAGVLESHNLSAERLLELNPSAIALYSTLAGQTGPVRKLSGFGSTGAAIAGVYPTTGWPDRDPAGPWSPYTDFPSPRSEPSPNLLANVEPDDSGLVGMYVTTAESGQSGRHPLLGL